MTRAVHHLDCGTMCPYLGPLTGGARWLEPGLMVCHVILVETERDGLVLIDTGFGSRDCVDPRRLSRPFRALVRPRLDLAQTAVAQVAALGYQPRDVRHVVVTHLDIDHAGGLHDFPEATVHLHREEHAAAMRRAGPVDRERYVPHQWAHGARWATYAAEGDTWMGIPAVRALDGLHDDVALVPMTGHSRGHSAVAVRAPGSDRWILHAGDAMFDRRELEPGGRAAPGLRAFAAAVQQNRRHRLASVEILRDLHRRSDVTVVCSHDPVMLERASFLASERPVW
jgi:glyoxylase-like metal-dependent hydrolase (beta-lactamase superfamily II)